MESPSELRSDLLRALLRLHDRRCWCAVPIGPHGFLQLGFGQRLVREVPLDAHPAQALRTHFPELGLFVECAWRLDSESGVVCGTRDALRPGGRLLEGLARLIDDNVARAEFSAPAGDLAIHFSSGLVLRLFADRVDHERDETNYSLYLPGETWTIGGGGRLRRERDERSGPPSLRVVR